MSEKTCSRNNQFNDTDNQTRTRVTYEKAWSLRSMLNLLYKGRVYKKRPKHKNCIKVKSKTKQKNKTKLIMYKKSG